MANEVVDINKGYVKIANNLFENIVFRDFTNKERAVICLIIRLSYGFNHKTAVIRPKARFMLAGLLRQNIDKTLKNLINKNVIISHGESVYSLNKYFDTWKIPVNKYFTEENFTALKSLQFEKNVISDITDCNPGDYKNEPEDSQICNTPDYTNVIPEITTCNTGDYKNVIVEITNKNNMLSPGLQISENCNTTDYTGVISSITKNEKMLSPVLQPCSGNEDSEGDTTPPKDIIKDMLKTCIKDTFFIEKEEQKKVDSLNQKFDPYFNNSIVNKFRQEYTRVFKRKNCYLDNVKINKLTEIGIDNPEFVNLLPDIMLKFSKIRFTDTPATLKWLINDGGWAGILNGDYDSFIREDTKEADSGFDLGIPVCEDM